MYQVPNQHNKTHYLTLIDKCTQILRQDRIWLRNLLKSNNEDVLYLFKNIPKNIDMKQLQIRLRKYIMRAKEKQKQQQLQKFKQNMHLPEFIQVASQKRNENFIHNKSQNKPRGPLRQNQSNEPKSSFVAKWNNYSHYNQSINLSQNRSHIGNMQSTLNQSNSLKKQWSNNYKPHSFNRNLNGQLANKLSTKNKSMSNLNKHNKSTTSLPKQKSIIQSKYQNNNEQSQQIGYKYGFGARSSSKSLKQLQNKIYQELRLFQQNKHKKQSQNMNKTYSQRSVQKFVEKQKPSITYQQTQRVAGLSKQNIDQILKFKLGNCDFESYRKSQQSQNEQQHQQEYHNLKDKTTSQKKLYHEGLFPPIQQQTERDSQSQRYPQQPLRFGIGNKQDMQDRNKMTFASFARASPNQPLKNYNMSQNRMVQSVKSNQNRKNIEQREDNNLLNSNELNLTNNNYEQPQVNKKISQSLYQSAQKKSDINENYIESDLHKSIMQSIKKSRQVYQQNNYINNQNNNYTNSVNSYGINNSFGYNNHQNSSEKLLQLPLPKLTQNMDNKQITSFKSSINNSFNLNNSSSLFSSTHDQNNLFTSPQLLNQCRNFLKKTQQINFQNSGIKQFKNSIHASNIYSIQQSYNHQNSYSKNYQSPTGSNQKMFKQTFNNFNQTGMINFPQPITITQSITKDFYQNSNSQARINQLFESKQSSVNKNIQFQTYSKPQFMIDSIQNSYNHNDSYHKNNSYHKNDSYNKNDSFKKSEFGQSSIKKNIINNQFYIPQSSNKKQQLSSNKKQQMIVGNHNRKNSSMKKHSQIQQTIAIAPSQNYLNNFIHSNSYQKKNNYQNNDSYNNSYDKSNQLNKVSSKKQQYKEAEPFANIQNFKTSQFPNISKQQPNNKSKKKQLSIQQLISLQDIIDKILQANQGNIQVDGTWLKHAINNQMYFTEEVANVLRKILKQYIQNNSVFNFVQIANTLHQQYKKNPNYHPKKSPSSDMCALLDIQQKGYITFDDIQSFVTQLQNAGVDNLQQIAHYIEEMFNMADFMEQKQISYVNLYIIKHEDCFENLWKYLSEFEFEISAEQ